MYVKYQYIIHNFGKCDDQKKYKDIIEVAMFPTPERFTDNSPI